MDPYIFISYAHYDAAEVINEDVKFLHEEGFTLWYDTMIRETHDFTKEIAKAIEKCALFMVFLSTVSIKRPVIIQEIDYARRCDKRILSIYLDLTPDGIREIVKDDDLVNKIEFQIGNVQGIVKHVLSSEQYRKALRRVLKDFRVYSARDMAVRWFETGYISKAVQLCTDESRIEEDKGTFKVNYHMMELAIYFCISSELLSRAKALAADLEIIARKNGDRLLLFRTLANRAIIERELGEYDTAWALYQEADTLIASVNDSGTTARLIEEKARLAYLVNDKKKAYCLIEECRNLLYAAGRRFSILESRERMGKWYLRYSDLGASLNEFEKMKTEADESNGEKLAEALHGIGLVKAKMGKYKESVGFYVEAVQQYVIQTNNIGKANVLGDLAVAQAMCGNLSDSMENFKKQRQIFDGLARYRDIQRSLDKQSYTFEYIRKYDDATVLVEQAIRIARQLDDRMGLLFLLGRIIKLNNSRMNYPAVVTSCEERYRIAFNMDDRHAMKETLSQLSNVFRTYGNLKVSIRFEKMVSSGEFPEQINSFPQTE